MTLPSGERTSSYYDMVEAEKLVIHELMANRPADIIPRGYRGITKVWKDWFDKLHTAEGKLEDFTHELNKATQRNNVLNIHEIHEKSTDVRNGDGKKRATSRKNMEARRMEKEKAKGLDKTTKLNMIVTEMTDRLLHDCDGYNYFDVDWTNQASINTRKVQNGNIKDLIVIIRQLKELLEIMSADSETTGPTTLTADNVTKLAEVREKLLKRNIRPDF